MCAFVWCITRNFFSSSPSSTPPASCGGSFSSSLLLSPSHVPLPLVDSWLLLPLFLCQPLAANALTLSEAFSLTCSYPFNMSIFPALPTQWDEMFRQFPEAFPLTCRSLERHIILIMPIMMAGKSVVGKGGRKGERERERERQKNLMLLLLLMLLVQQQSPISDAPIPDDADPLIFSFPVRRLLLPFSLSVSLASFSPLSLFSVCHSFKGHATPEPCRREKRCKNLISFSQPIDHSLFSVLSPSFYPMLPPFFSSKLNDSQKLVRRLCDPTSTEQT